MRSQTKCRRTMGLAMGVMAGMWGPGQAGANLVDYNTPGDLMAHFSLNHAGAGIRYSEAAAGGLGGSRAIDFSPAIDETHTTAALSGQSFGLTAVGDTVTLSQFVLRQPHNTTFGINFSFMQLGVLTDSFERLGIAAAPDAYASLRILSDPTVSDARVFLQSEVKTSGSIRTQGNIAGQTADLIAGHWYRFGASFEFVSMTEVRITGALEDWGTTGSAPVSTVLELTAANPQALVDMSALPGDTVLGDPSVWAGWRGFDRGGANLVDDFSAVPEPTSAVMLAVGAALLARRPGRSPRSRRPR